jgi:NADP-dependent 3-hydroxy acid dehydrogenase YdfG
MVRTEFVDNFKDPEMGTAGMKRMEDIVISPDAVAEAVVYAISQPDTVDITQISDRYA